MPTPFARGASVMAVLGALLAAVTPFVLPGPEAFGWSVVASGTLALVFAGYNAYWVGYLVEPRFAPAIVAAALGAWLAVAPPVYGVGGVVVAGVQGGAAVLASFSAYTALEAFEGL